MGSQTLLHASATIVLVILIIIARDSECLNPASIKTPKKTYGGGAGVGRLVVDESITREGNVQCHYDMVFVERLQGRAKQESGLYIPDEDLPKLLLCRVLSIGPGREEENGMIAPNPNISVGDIILAKNPWGIGPKDEETASGRFFSYMRIQDIAALITGGLAPDGEENEVA